MLSQRGEEFRSQRMLQSYNESYSDLNYHHQQIHMPPTAEYNNSVVNPIDHSWYNSYNIHGGVQNGGVDYYGRGSETKSSDWSSYHSDPDSPFIPPPPQINNNSEEQYANIGPTGGQMIGQQMQQMDGPMIMNSHSQIMVPPTAAQQDSSLMMNQVHNGLMTNGVVENTQVDQQQIQPISSQTKEEDNVPKIDVLSASPENKLKDGTKDGMRLPGFHQTFGNITEIGRFSQHDDYFERRPNEVIEEPKVSEPVEPPAPKRKPRGRKRKQVVEPRENNGFTTARPGSGLLGGGGGSNSGGSVQDGGPSASSCMQQEICGVLGNGGVTTGGGGGPLQNGGGPAQWHHYHQQYAGSGAGQPGSICGTSSSSTGSTSSSSPSSSAAAAAPHHHHPHHHHHQQQQPAAPPPPPPPLPPSSHQYHHHHHQDGPPPPPPPPPPPSPYHHNQWRTHPYYHQQHYQHHHHPQYAPPPPPQPPSTGPHLPSAAPPSHHHNVYYQHYNDCLPYNHYNSYPNNWHMNRDYMLHNYPSYV